MGTVGNYNYAMYVKSSNYYLQYFDSCTDTQYTLTYGRTFKKECLSFVLKSFFKISHNQITT